MAHREERDSLAKLVPASMRPQKGGAIAAAATAMPALALLSGLKPRQALEDFRQHPFLVGLPALGSVIGICLLVIIALAQEPLPGSRGANNGAIALQVTSTATAAPASTPTRVPPTMITAPTATLAPPTETPLPPTATPLPPSATPLPSDTPAPPTATPVPPTPTSPPPPPAATVAPLPTNSNLPATGVPKTQPKVRPTPVPVRAIYYTVRYGDNLTSIAYRYGTTVAAIQRANRLYSSVIYAGQVLVIPRR